MNNIIKKGCIDVWNAFMLKGASFDPIADIPICPCTADSLPYTLISYDDAKTLYNTNIKNGINSFHVNSFIHFYINDIKFDGKKKGIWADPYNALKIIKHFDGIITPDFSTNADFPDPTKRFNTLRMRAFGYWIGTYGIKVINNVRWGTPETWEYCFAGIPVNSIISIGAVASGLNNQENRLLFELGLIEMIRTIKPHTIIFYGATHSIIVDKIKSLGINVIPFNSRTNEVFLRRSKQ